MVRGLRLKGSVWSLGQREKEKWVISLSSNILSKNRTPGESLFESEARVHYNFESSADLRLERMR